MSLTKENRNVECIKALVNPYDLPIFAVDMIKDMYLTTDPFLIGKLLLSLFDINLPISDIIDLMYEETNFKSVDFTISTRDIF